MESLVLSFVAALVGGGDSPGNPGLNPGKIYIIVPRTRAYLADLMARAFEGRKDVEIIVDRRSGDRRTRRQPVPVERRRGERRRFKEEVIEVVIGTSGRPGGAEGPA
jgi:hypothetical protein